MASSGNGHLRNDGKSHDLVNLVDLTAPAGWIDSSSQVVFENVNSGQNVEWAPLLTVPVALGSYSTSLWLSFLTCEMETITV